MDEGNAISSVAVKRQTVPQWEYHGGNLLRLIQQVAGELGKHSAVPAETEEFERRRLHKINPPNTSVELKCTPAVEILTQMTRGNPSRLDGIISASIFLFAYYSNRIPLAPLVAIYLRLFRIRFIHDYGFEWICIMLFRNHNNPQVGAVPRQAPSGRSVIRIYGFSTDIPSR